MHKLYFIMVTKHYRIDVGNLDMTKGNVHLSEREEALDVIRKDIVCLSS